MQKDNDQRGLDLRKGRDSSRESDDKAIARHYFFGIGISNYQYLSLLPNATRDVKDISKLLISEYEFDDQNVFELYNENATVDNIQKKLIELEVLKEQDSLIIYFAGHGDYNNNDGYWCAYDYDPNAPRHGAFYETEIISIVKNLPCQKLLIIEDRCYGATTPEVLAKWRDLSIPDSRVIYVLSSVGKNEKASDGVEGHNSPFATALKKILEDNTNEILYFNNELIEKYYNQTSFKFFNLFSGSKTSAFTLYKKKKHLQFWGEEIVWKNLFEEQEKHPVRLLKLFLKSFPKSLKKDEIIQKQKNGEIAVSKEWANLLGNTVDAFADFIQNFKHYDSKEINKAFDIVYHFINDYPAARANATEKEAINAFVERQKILKESSDLKYQTIILENFPKNEAYLFKSDSIEFGIMPVSVELFQRFSLSELLKDYKRTIKHQMGEDYDIQDSHPAANISWIEAIQFANWLSSENNFKPVYHMVDSFLTGIDAYADGFRLPTMAEWEFAARTGNVESIDWEDSSKLPWHEKNSGEKIQTIGAREPDNAGLYDMLGNVYEWCWDFFGYDSQRKKGYICKGGSYYSTKDKLNISEYSVFYEASLEVGFRLVRSISPDG